MNGKIQWMVACVAMVAAFVTAADKADALVILDDFNRANSTNMGPNWNEVTGDFEIVNNRARGSGLGSMIYVGQTSNSVTVDVHKINGGNNDLGAIVLGHADSNNSLYIKVQSQNGVANFESLGFYFGDNGANNGAWSESFFDAGGVLTPFTDARLTVELVGNTVSLSIDNNFDNIADQVISRGSVPTALLGTGIGLGGWTGTGAEVDNFAIAGSAVPEPATAALGLFGLAALGLRRRRRAA